MTITGRQIREARELLGLSVWQIAKAANVSTATVILAEIDDGEPSITSVDVDAIRHVLEVRGVEFAAEVPWARLRKPEP